MSFIGRLKKLTECDGDMLFWAIVFSLFYTAVYSVSLLAFGREAASSSPTAFLAAAVIIFAREILRSAVADFAKKSGRAFFFGSAAAVGFAVLNLGIYFAANRAEGLSAAISQKALPMLAASCVLTVMSCRSGALACMIFSLITEAAVWLLPFRAAMTDRMSAFVQTALCMMFLIALDCMSAEDSENPDTEKKSEKRGRKRAFTACGFAAIAAVSAFCMGWLPIKPVSIASGSMQPEYSVGDMVVVSGKTDGIKVGDVIQFSRDNHTVIHRVTAVEEKDGAVCYTTKGDANNAEDSWKVSEEEIIGKVVTKIPYAGRLTLWLHSDS
jgi:signal peptidase I